MPPDTDSPGSVVVVTIQTRLHTPNIHSLDNSGRSLRLGLAFLVADNGLGQSSSISAIQAGPLTGGMKPTGGGGMGMMGIIGTPPPLHNCQWINLEFRDFSGPERNEATNLPVVDAGGRTVTIGKAVGSGRGPEV